MRPCRPGRKLTVEDASVIRELKGLSHAALARTFNVSRLLVRKVRSGEAWPAECKTTYAKRRMT